MKKFQRSARVAEQIRRDLSQIMARELKDPRVGMVSLTSVEVTPDYAHAKVYFTTLEVSRLDEIEQALNHSAGFLRRELGRGLHIHTLPQLSFVYDQSLAEGSRMDALINQALSRTADE